MRRNSGSSATRVTAAALALLLAVACQSKQQPDEAPYLKLREVDLEGDSTDVRERPGIVDINSKIHIDLDQPKIAEKVRSQVGEGGPSAATLLRVEEIAKSIQSARAALPGLSQALRTFEGSTRALADIQTLEGQFREFSAKTAPIEALIGDSPQMRMAFENRMNELIERSPESSQTEQDRILLEIAGDWVEDQREDSQRRAQEQGGYVRLGAWLDREGDRSPIHLRDFDTLQEGEFYEVDRWKISLTQDQQKKLKELEQTAQAINDAGGDPKILFTAWSNTLLGAMRTLLDQCIEEFRTKAKTFAETHAPALQAAKDLHAAAAELARLARSLRDKYSEFDPKSMTPEDWLEALSGLQTDLASIVDAAGDVDRALEALKAAAGGVAAGVKPFFDELVESSCANAVYEKYRLLARQLGIQRAAAEIEEFSEAVLKLDVTNLPATTDFDLRRTGLREPQDHVLIRLAAGRSTAPDMPSAPEETIATRDLELEMILPHLETAVGLIFANPTGSSALTGEFQAAPSYSVLYKWGSRESRLRNTLLDWGVGLNMSAVDFDKDDTPELGIAGVVSLLHNYVQVGYGYNPFETQAYWFFGVNLPLPTFSYPVGGGEPPK